MNEQTYYMADFETVTYDGITKTEVWASAIVPLDAPTEKDGVIIDNSIDNFMWYILLQLHGDTTIYFHNLKFDGMFILSWLKKHKDKFREFHYVVDGETRLRKRDEMRWNNGGVYIYSISSKGQWYSITLKYRGKIIRFLDSLKLLPFSVAQIGKAFNTKFQKTSIEYEGMRKAGSVITDEEKDYISNDVLVVKEALNIMFAEGHNKMTIGACCMTEYKQLCWHDKKEYATMFPDLYKVECPIEGFDNADEYIRKSYKGGWCYLKRGCENKLYTGLGTVCDVNSLYSSVMTGESGNKYPYGLPTWFEGAIPDRALETFKDGTPKFYFFIRVRTKFRLKKGYLPTVQIKGSPFYNGREWLETSDYKYKGEYYQTYEDYDGTIKEVKPTMTLTCTDWKLLNDHYDLIDCEILDGCYFRCASGFFDTYINKWAEIKQKETGAKRTLAKLFLNNLYGKLASSTDSSYKVLDLDSENVLRSQIVEENEKKAGYIPIGSAITSYARNFTIRCAQKNYKHFIYSDTDSIHCLCAPDDIIGAPEHPTAFLHWKYESCWDKAIFVRQKTYIEHQTHDNREQCEPFYNIKCAGMGKNAKEILNEKLESGELTLKDFKTGLEIPHNLKAMNIDGGVVLRDCVYKLH